MAQDIRYNVSELFQLAFGINTPVYITEPLLRDAPTNISYAGLKTITEYSEENTMQSWMGTPIMFSATFKAGTYNKYKDNGEIEQVRVESLVLPPATMFEFRRAKNITRTNVLGSNGTVKEIFGFDDWVIDVRGLCLDEPETGEKQFRSAQSQWQELLKWEGLSDGFGVEGTAFQNRGFERVCIAEYSDNIPQGQPGVVAFQMQLISDEAMEFGILNNEAI